LSLSFEEAIGDVDRSEFVRCKLEMEEVVVAVERWADLPARLEAFEAADDNDKDGEYECEVAVVVRVDVDERDSDAICDARKGATVTWAFDIRLATASGKITKQANK
jgi:hypothetical protein